MEAEGSSETLLSIYLTAWLVTTEHNLKTRLTDWLSCPHKNTGVVMLAGSYSIADKLKVITYM